jgi:hypothetical protein
MTSAVLSAVVCYLVGSPQLSGAARGSRNSRSTASRTTASSAPCTSAEVLDDWRRPPNALGQRGEKHWPLPGKWANSGQPCENRAWGTDAPLAVALAPKPPRQEPAPRLAPRRGASHSNAPADPLVRDPQRRTESIRENRTSTRKLQQNRKEWCVHDGGESRLHTG